MPFTKHIIDPIHISECPLPFGEPNELECLSNLTLANVIRQLSSLGQHANRIFDELIQDAARINNRSLILNQRIDNLKVKVSQLDLQNEDVAKDDLKIKKQFKSSVKIDQQVVSRRTMPDSIRLLYNNADPPPALDKLNSYRTDGKDCMKFYTDPEFFFNIWCNELMKDNETRKNEKKKRKTRGDKSNAKSPINENQPKQYADPNPARLDSLQPNDRLKANSLLMNQPQVGANALNMAASYQLRQQQQQQQLLQIKQQQQQPLQGQQQLPPQQIYTHHNASIDFKSQAINNGNGHTGNDLTDQSFLPPPPSHLLQSSVHSTLQNNYEIYAESNDYNNGNRNSSLSVQQASLIKQQERPALPPPPIPETNFSDLQQMQQQMIRKFDGIVTIGSRENPSNSDLPPPPSPPITHESHDHRLGTSLHDQQFGVLVGRINNLHLAQPETTDGFPLPPPPPPDLPPPPSHCLPLPPPLPPLVEPDTSSSSHSSSPFTANDNTNDSKLNITEQQATNPPQQQSTSRSFLDDINKGRFVLKPTQKDNLDNRKKITSASGSTVATTGGVGVVQGDENTIQPFVNNSDVAAIIDFVRKFRTHVQDSSDDEENSDWDE